MHGIEKSWFCFIYLRKKIISYKKMYFKYFNIIKLIFNLDFVFQIHANF